MGNQKNIRGIVLSDLEIQICKRLIWAAVEADKATGFRGFQSVNLTEEWIPIDNARKLTPYLDLYKLKDVFHSKALYQKFFFLLKFLLRIFPLLGHF